MKITPEEIFNIVKIPHAKSTLTGWEWDNFINWYKSLLRFIFKLDNVLFSIYDLDNRFCVQFNNILIGSIEIIIRNTNNQYIKDSFYVDMWKNCLIFCPKDIKAIEYFCTVNKLIEGDKNDKRI